MAKMDQPQDTAGDIAQQTREMAEDAYRRSEPEIERYRAELSNMIREKPVQSIAVAGVIAFAIGALLRR